MKHPKYIVVGGNPFRGYTNTLSFTSLNVVGSSSSVEEIKKIVNENFDSCGGLLIIVDTETGQQANI
jgi:hypothetical protein